VARLLEGLAHPADFHDFAGVHHCEPVAGIGHDAEVVRDQQHRHRQPLAQVHDEIEHLRLDGDIERGGGLVRDQQLGLAGERAGDHHALRHAAGELVRVVGEAAARVGYADQRQQLGGALSGCALGESSALLLFMGPYCVHQLAPYGVHRRQRRHRLLEHHAGAAAAHLAHLRLAEAYQLGAGEPDRA
jgi:hypothetical protein